MPKRTFDFLAYRALRSIQFQIHYGMAQWMRVTAVTLFAFLATASASTPLMPVSKKGAPHRGLAGEYQFEFVERGGNTARLTAGDRLLMRVTDTAAELYLEPGSAQGVSQIIKSFCSRLISKGALDFNPVDSEGLRQAVLKDGKTVGRVEFLLQELRGDKGEQPCPVSLFLPQLLGSTFSEPVLPGKMKIAFGYEVLGERLKLTWKNPGGLSSVVFVKTGQKR